MSFPTNSALPVSMRNTSKATCFRRSRAGCAKGVLNGYRIFMNRYPVGRPWDALFIYEYRDLEASEARRHRRESEGQPRERADLEAVSRHQAHHPLRDRETPLRYRSER